MRVVLADAEQIARLGLKILRALGGRHDERAAGVRNQTAVEHAQRIRDRLRRQNVLQR